MKTIIEGGWVVAFNGESHEVYQDGCVVYEGDHILHAGGPFDGEVDERIDARGKLVSPGFINAHIHTLGPGGDYLLQDQSRTDWRTANFMAFGAPLKDRRSPPPPEDMEALRTFVLLHALKGGATTILDVGGLSGDWDSLVSLVESIGARVYISPAYRDRHEYTDEQGRLYYHIEDEGGRQEFQRAIDFINKYQGAAGGLISGMLCPQQTVTCSEKLLRATKDAARDLDVPVHTHAAGNLREFNRILDQYRRTPVEYLSDIGFLDDRTLLGHAVFTTAHPSTVYPYGDDLKILADSGATVGHSPYKCAKMSVSMHSYQRYLDAGVRVALGTDTYPMDLISEMRMASIMTRVADHNYQAGQPRDVYNSVTLGICQFLARNDLGRLSPGAKADILLIDLDHMESACYRDPIKALVDFGSSRDLDTVIVDGRTLISGGRHLHVDEDEVYARAAAATQRFWKKMPSWHWAGLNVDEVVPPAFTTHRTDEDSE